MRTSSAAVSPAPALAHASRSTARLFRLLLAASAVAAGAAGIATPAATAAQGGVSSGGPETYVSSSPRLGSFPLVAGGKAAPIVVSSSDHAGVVRVVNDLQADVKRVTGVQPAVSADQIPADAKEIVLVGTIGTSPLIDGLVAAHKLDVSGIAGKWETTLEQVVSNPLPGVSRAFVIAGSDQRGTIFGAYDVSKQIGVSPWYWWDDVPARHQRRALRAARTPHPGHARHQVPRLLHQRREPGARHLGARLLRPRPGRGLPRRLQPQLLRQGLRDHAAAEGQLPLAGGLGQGLRRGRSSEPRDGQAVRRRHGHLARGADDARHRGVEPPRRGRGPRRRRQHRHAGPRPLRRHRRVELPTQRRRDQEVLGGRHPAHGRTRTSRASSRSACAATATSACPTATASS